MIIILGVIRDLHAEGGQWAYNDQNWSIGYRSLSPKKNARRVGFIKHKSCDFDNQKSFSVLFDDHSNLKQGQKVL